VEGWGGSSFHYVIRQTGATAEDRESILEHYRINSGNMACDLLNVSSTIQIASTIRCLPSNGMRNCTGIKE
jgi:hypothetical protein